MLPRGAPGKGRIFLIDAMSFIFRAYHAMARQRPSIHDAMFQYPLCRIVVCRADGIALMAK